VVTGRSEQQVLQESACAGKGGGVVEANQRGGMVAFCPVCVTGGHDLIGSGKKSQKRGGENEEMEKRCMA